MAWVNLDNLMRFYTKLKEKMYLKTEVDTKLDGKAASSHTHDDRYYTESEINSKINTLNNNIANAGKFYGIDTSVVLTSQDGNVGSGGRSYTATQDCYVFIYNNHGGNAGSIYINGVWAMTFHQATCSLVLKKGQKITVYHGDGGNQIIRLRAFGLKE